MDTVGLARVGTPIAHLRQTTQGYIGGSLITPMCRLYEGHHHWGGETIAAEHPPIGDNGVLPQQHAARATSLTDDYACRRYQSIYFIGDLVHL